MSVPALLPFAAVAVLLAAVATDLLTCARGRAPTRHDLPVAAAGIAVALLAVALAPLAARVGTGILDRGPRLGTLLARRLRRGLAGLAAGVVLVALAAALLVAVLRGGRAAAAADVGPGADAEHDDTTAASGDQGE